MAPRHRSVLFVFVGGGGWNLYGNNCQMNSMFCIIGEDGCETCQGITITTCRDYVRNFYHHSCQFSHFVSICTQAKIL
jgi:hypothetical protein